ncbi:hypothetical protein AKN88_03795 [Thiopseudomonas alkaliphila]|uniref:DUF1294 domain-containing protein n=1 Tax=Thiopseudomonas alkaliphila TaxID=1697053 RepID=A0A0K1XDB0_9GAMM|nr:DUF1294 domain-containing protein [Thiopseudomonas alkaliphila]AKX59157.1 hypothetical protein AKN88_03795 [Thiopseudomonas alkaliphila]
MQKITTVVWSRRCYGLAMLLLIAGFALFYWRHATIYPVVIYLLLSVVSFIQYFVDKQRAVQQRPRIAEKNLHWLELLGGWPGAYLAQQWLRHKTQKTAFLWVFWCIVSLHLLLWAGWALYIFRT